MVKCRHIGRGAYNDQIIARLGKLIGAPVGKPTIVDIPSDLVITNPDISALPPGLAHGVEFIADTSGRLNGIDLNGHLDNKLRFAKLAVLFGWLQGADVQFIYSTVEPKYVYSVDHGHFFPGGPPWTIASLQSATAPQLYAPIVSALSLTKSEMSSAVSAVTALTDQQISDCVSLVPPDWGVDAGEKVALTQYLIDRRGILPSLVLG